MATHLRECISCFERIQRLETQRLETQRDAKDTERRHRGKGVGPQGSVLSVPPCFKKGSSGNFVGRDSGFFVLSNAVLVLLLVLEAPESQRFFSSRRTVSLRTQVRYGRWIVHDSGNDKSQLPLGSERTGVGCIELIGVRVFVHQNVEPMCHGKQVPLCRSARSQCLTKIAHRWREHSRFGTTDAATLVPG